MENEAKKGWSFSIHKIAVDDLEVLHNKIRAFS